MGQVTEETCRLIIEYADRNERFPLTVNEMRQLAYLANQQIQVHQDAVFDAASQYDDNDVHVGSGLPLATCPCGLCEKMRGLKEKHHG
ncbi:hypothetical protein [Burkholderia sp. EMB26]|uniref:hypothetical protein n=1 Tax=Burkholderia sp. EMB26 TaxID=2854261 RepID=UPI00215A704C|nr:hypothetical protein [Burkholderia sp. EMB26]UVE57660.1 hypothetical protein KU887_19965 [Burkholderia sp. EMB26]